MVYGLSEQAAGTGSGPYLLIYAESRRSAKQVGSPSFYPELDATTDHGKALLAAGAPPDSLRAFADLLRGRLATLEP